MLDAKAGRRDTFTNADALKIIVNNNGLGVRASMFDFEPFPDLEQGVRDDVSWLKGHNAIVKGTEISGWVCELETGKVRKTEQHGTNLLLCCKQYLVFIGHLNP